MDFSIRGYMDYDECIGYVENENGTNAEFNKTVLHKGNRFKAFFVQAKRRIPAKVKIFLSKIKQFFLRIGKKKEKKT